MGSSDRFAPSRMTATFHPFSTAVCRSRRALMACVLATFGSACFDDDPLPVAAPANPAGYGPPPAAYSASGAAALVATGGACDPAAASWSPGALPGLVVWLDAEDAPQGYVQAWRDRSPAANDARQPVPAYQPMRANGAIGGYPAVRFDGRRALLEIADAPSLEWAFDDYAILVVARFSVDRGTTFQMLYQKVATTAPWDGPSLYVNGAKPTQATTVTAQMSQYAFATSAHDRLDDAPHVFVSRRVGAALEVRVDGAPEGATVLATPIDVSAPRRPVQIGQNGDHRPGFQALEGDVAEVVAVRGILPDDQLRVLECYLTVKYSRGP